MTIINDMELRAPLISWVPTDFNGGSLGSASLVEQRRNIRACSSCGKIGEDKSLKTCGGCEIYRYCSIECQKKDWSTHKIECKKLKELEMTNRREHLILFAERLQTSNLLGFKDDDLYKFNFPDFTKTKYLIVITVLDHLQFFHIGTKINEKTKPKNQLYIKLREHYKFDKYESIDDLLQHYKLLMSKMGFSSSSIDKLLERDKLILVEQFKHCVPIILYSSELNYLCVTHIANEEWNAIINGK